MRRRDFITLLGGAGASWPLAAHAQQPEQLRRIGVLMNTADDPLGQARLKALQQALQQLGWSEGRNVRFDTRWGENNVDRDRRDAAELVGLSPEVIVAGGTLGLSALQHLTHTVPIVFVGVTDPVGGGFVETLARPGGNATGFMNFEFGSSGKWLELLKQIAPNVTRAAVLKDAANPAASAEYGAIQAAGQSLGVDVSPLGIRDAAEIEHAVAAFARSTNGGLIVSPSAETSVHHELIVALAARYNLPTVYSYSFDVVGGGLISYGPDPFDQYQRAASYVDRILKGEKPTDLPVQAPTKYRLVINLKTAKALGLAIPDKLLATADEVIE